MTIIRAPRPDSNFYMLDKAISEDARLSWSARGMLIFLLGKPDNWRVSIAHLVESTQHSQKKSGRDAVYSIINELIDAGYVYRVTPRCDDGKFGSPVLMVRETPHQELPVTGKPDTDYPEAANPTLVSIESKQGLNLPSIEKTKARAKKPACDFVLPDWVPVDAWDGYVQMRKEKKKPMTNRARDLVIDELDKLCKQGHDPASVLEQSTRNSWTDVYPLKNKPAQQRSTTDAAMDFLRQQGAFEQ